MFQAFLRDTESVDFIQPDPGAGVAWHAEITPRGEGDGTDLRAVRQAGTFELLGEKSPVEVLQPFEDCGIGIFSRKGAIGDPIDLRGCEFRTQHIIQEEVVELIWPDEILSFLGDHAVFRWQKLWADRSVQDIKQDGGKLFLAAGVRVIADQMTDKSLGDGAVHGVHRHMISVIGRPPQGKLGEVAGSDHDSSGLVGDVHEYLCPLSRLTVLIGDVVHAYVVTDVAEVKGHRLVEADFPEGDTELADQGAGIPVGPVSSAEAGHGDGDDAFPWKVKHVECLNGYQKGERGIETSGNADHGVGCVDVVEPFLETHGLYGQDFLAALVPCGRILRNKGMRSKGAGQRGLFFPELEGDADMIAEHPAGGSDRHCTGERCRFSEGGPVLSTIGGRSLKIGIGAGSAALSSETADVYLRIDDSVAEPFGFRQNGSVLRDDIVTAEDQILCGFPFTGGGVDVSADQAGRLL